MRSGVWDFMKADDALNRTIVDRWKAGDALDRIKKVRLANSAFCLKTRHKFSGDYREDSREVDGCVRDIHDGF